MVVVFIVVIIIVVVDDDNNNIITNIISLSGKQLAGESGLKHNTVT